MTGLYIIYIKNYDKRQDIGQTSEDAFDFEDKNLRNSLNTLKV